MQHRQAHIMILKPAAETGDQLRCQSNFRHQHQGLTTLFKSCGNRPQVDLGFAAPGYSMQQERLKSCRTKQSLINLSYGLLLGRVKFNSLMLNHRDFSKRVPTSLDLLNLQKTQFHQTL